MKKVIIVKTSTNLFDVGFEDEEAQNVYAESFSDLKEKIAAIWGLNESDIIFCGDCLIEVGTFVVISLLSEANSYEVKTVDEENCSFTIEEWSGDWGFNEVIGVVNEKI